ncbi:MAG: ABC transporter permease [Chlamydiales bacterium]|nr:ABC transporter permease [Chlamydiales bacterium]
MTQKTKHDSFWRSAASQFRRHWLGMISLGILALFVLVGVYAPFLASSKPLVVVYDAELYFPLFRYLFYRGFFTSRLDLFFNLMIFTLPLFLLSFLLPISKRRYAIAAILTAQLLLFLFVAFRQPYDPEANPKLAQQRLKALQPTEWKGNPLFASIPPPPTWQFELDHMSPYAKLNEVLQYRLRFEQHLRLMHYYAEYEQHVRQRDVGSNSVPSIPSLWQTDKNHEDLEIKTLQQTVQSSLEKYREAKTELHRLRTDCGTSPSQDYCADLNKASPELRKKILTYLQDVATHDAAKSELLYIGSRRYWLDEQNSKISFIMMPLFRPYHWEDDASGEQALNQYLPWWELTRTDRKDLAAALIFGVRISIVVGLTAVALALLIGIPIGCLSGYYAGTTDMVICRLMEIWEAMPTFFMLLLVISVLQSKSIFLVIAIIGLFGWTGFSRYVRGEFFKQRNLPYVEACRAQGFNDSYIIFSHILPNAIPPLLTLLPFAIMGAIGTEAGLSFLGLGEEGSCSWGVLMDEGRRAFPGESYLLWPPAILLTLMLVAIALVGDALRDSIDPRLHRE